MNRLGAAAAAASGGGGADQPPPNKETLRRAAQVRIDVLTGSLQGLGFGLVFGAGGWPLFRRTVLRGQVKFLHKKYHIFATLVVGALGSFVGSLASCRNSLEVQLAGLESEHARGQRQADEAYFRRRQALQQRGAGGGDGGIGAEQGAAGGVFLDAGSAFVDPFAQQPPRPSSSQQSSGHGPNDASSSSAPRSF